MLGAAAFSAPAQAKPKKPISVYPVAKTPVASNSTTFSFRGIKKKHLGPIVVKGSKSGRHKGRRMAHPDGRGVSFIPKRRFKNGEKVFVRTRRNIIGSTKGNFWVRIGRFYGSHETGKTKPSDPITDGLKSRPGLKPPNLEVKTNAGAQMGKIFFAPTSEGMTIANNQGKISWFQPVGFGGTGETVLNFRKQTYRNRPVLTYWKGASSLLGYAQIGYFEILNRKYKRIAKFRPGNGYKPDVHEFVITPQNTALVLSYRGVTWNMKKFGGPKNARVLDNVVQEVDIKTGAVIFEWHSIGNVGVGTGTGEVPKDKSPFDYFHANSIQVDGNSFLVSGRRHSTVYRIDRATGRIRWALRGDGQGRRDFKMGPGTSFGYQHDAQRLPNGDISLLDNGSARFDEVVNPESSGLVLRLSGKTKQTRKATVVRRNNHPDTVVSGSQANAQFLPGYGMFIGWGSTRRMSEFDKDGNMTFDAVFPDTKMESYRAFKAPWHGKARARPAIASKAGDPDGATVWASWNGASNIRTWQVLTGPDSNNLSEVATAPWDDLETEIDVTGAVGAVVRVVALDKDDKVLGRSGVIPLGEQSR